MKSFFDAGGWLAVLIETDQYHRIGRAYFEEFLDANGTAVTSDFVLDEVITRLRYDAGHRKASEFLTLIGRAIASGSLLVRRIDEGLWCDAEAIFPKYADARLSFTDCTSFALLRREPVDEVFGFDGHFEMMGFLLRPKG